MSDELDEVRNVPTTTMGTQTTPVPFASDGEVVLQSKVCGGGGGSSGEVVGVSFVILVTCTVVAQIFCVGTEVDVVVVVLAVVVQCNDSVAALSKDVPPSYGRPSRLRHHCICR